jgi:hypothetical protein
MGILDLLLSLFTQGKTIKHTATSALADSIAKDVLALESGKADPMAKKAIMGKAKKLIQEIGGPDAIIGGYAVTMGEIGATYMFMEWKLFDKIPTGSSISYKELAAHVGAEESVITRIGGMLVASGRLVQTSSGHVTHSAHSKLFISDNPAGNLFRVMIDHGLRGYLHWPEYFAQYGAKEPQGPSDNPFTFSWGHPTMNMWEIIAKDEVRQAIFSSGMRAQNSISAKHGGPASLYDFSWIGDEAIKTAGEGKELKKLQPLIVDVGGSHGDTLKDIMKHNPTIPQERVVLQDRPEVIEEAIALDVPELRNITRIPHDFNDEQPVKGALVYLLRRVLHDYGDLICIRILARLSAALPRDDPRARVLIMDQVLSDPPTPGNAAADLIMFNIGGKERSPAMFDKIVGEAGMKVVKIHRRPGTEVGVVECALK